MERMIRVGNKKSKCKEKCCVAASESIDEVLAEAEVKSELGGAIRERSEEENPMRVVMQMWYRLKERGLITCKECNIIGEAVTSLCDVLNELLDVYEDEDDDEDDDYLEKTEV